MHVPYKGVAQVVPAVLAGDVAVVTSGPAALLGHHKAGKVRMLATVNADRWPGLPEIPTAVEAGFPGVRMDISIGLLAPAGTPPETVRRLNDAAARWVPQVSGLPMPGTGSHRRYAPAIRAVHPRAAELTRSW